ncbi:MAG: O-antigen ligase family protein, partial [Acidimicrobiales bacterium]|nr:O-antigen ligase family protein [Acidimicrobiales bacterium]
PRARPLLAVAFVAGLYLNVVVAAVQVLVDLDGSWLAAEGNLPTGLTSSPPAFAALCVAGLALAVPVALRGRDPAAIGPDGSAPAPGGSGPGGSVPTIDGSAPLDGSAPALGGSAPALGGSGLGGSAPTDGGPAPLGPETVMPAGPPTSWSSDLAAEPVTAPGPAGDGSAVGRVRARFGAAISGSGWYGPAALVGVALSAFGIALTRSWVAIAVGIVVVAGALVVRRPDLRRIGMVAAAVLVGVLLCLPFALGADEPVESPGDGWAARTEMWGHGVGAWLDRPATGWGPGRFQEATSPRISRQFAIDAGPDRLYPDAHNVAVEALTTLGPIGLGLLVAWVVVAARGARGPLAWLAAGCGLVWLLSPVSVAVAPVALIALGAARGPVPAPASHPDAGPDPARAAGVEPDAGPVEPDRDPVEGPGPPAPALRTGGGRTALAAALVVGSIVAVAVMWGGTLVRAGEDSADLDAIDRAERVFGADPALSDLRARAIYSRSDDMPTGADLAALLAAAEETVARDPSDPLAHVQLASVQRLTGDHRAADDSLEAALDRNPWSVAAWFGVEQAARDAGDDERAAEASEVLCALDPVFCG